MAASLGVGSVTKTTASAECQQFINLRTLAPRSVALPGEKGVVVLEHIYIIKALFTSLVTSFDNNFIILNFY